jgi:23S rRNA (guanosine2251-2'-O)-methyltransferase
MLSAGYRFVKSFRAELRTDMNEQHNVFFGINPVLEKLRASPTDIEEILIAEGSSAPAVRGIDLQAKRLSVRVNYVPAKLLDRLAGGKRHQGVAARVIAFSYSSLADLLAAIPSVSGSVWILILDSVTDPRNFGALLRTAESVGIQHVVIPKDRSVAVTPTVIKASAGAVHHLKIYRATNLRRAILSLKQLGFWIVGLDVQAAETIFSRVYPQHLGIVLGSEGGGIRPLLMQECDYRVSIPMMGKVSSLNVSVAAAIFLYELVRQARSH